MLTALLLGGGTFVSHERLTSLLWDDPPASSQANLRQYAQRLRWYLRQGELLGRLRTQRAGARAGSCTGGYQLRIELGELDSRIFVDFANRGNERLTRNDHEAAADLLRRGLGLWRGEAGEGTPASRVLADLLRPLTDRRLIAFEDYHAALIALGNAGQIVADASAHAAAHPARERAWGQLIQAHYLSGDPVGAQETYPRAHSALRDHAGSGPSPVLRHLHHAVLTFDDVAVRRWRAYATASAPGDRF